MTLDKLRFSFFFSFFTQFVVIGLLGVLKLSKLVVFTRRSGSRDTSRKSSLVLVQRLLECVSIVALILLLTRITESTGVLIIIRRRLLVLLMHGGAISLVWIRSTPIRSCAVRERVALSVSLAPVLNGILSCIAAFISAVP